MARNEQLIRQHKILQVLERVRFGKTIAEISADLVDELGLKSVSSRTIRRDLSALQAAGIDVDVHSTQRGKVWKMGPLATETTKISFTATEIIALSMGRELMHPLAGTPFWSGIESFWQKIQKEVPGTVLEHYEKFRKTLLVHGVTIKSYEKQQGIIRAIRRAITEHRVVEIQYQTPGKPLKTRMIEPVSVLFSQSSLYVIASACEKPVGSEGRMRCWKLDRFKSAKPLDKWYKAPENFDLEEFVGRTLGVFFRDNEPSDYVIRISPKGKFWVTEEPLHANQKIKQLPDGYIELTLPAGANMDIIPRVLNMGEHAEIISPQQARDEMTRIVNQMAEKYNGPTTKN